MSRYVKKMDVAKPVCKRCKRTTKRDNYPPNNDGVCIYCLSGIVYQKGKRRDVALKEKAFWEAHQNAVDGIGKANRRSWQQSEVTDSEDEEEVVKQAVPAPVLRSPIREYAENKDDSSEAESVGRGITLDDIVGKLTEDKKRLEDQIAEKRRELTDLEAQLRGKEAKLDLLLRWDE